MHDGFEPSDCKANVHKWRQFPTDEDLPAVPQSRQLRSASVEISLEQICEILGPAAIHREVGDVNCSLLASQAPVLKAPRCPVRHAGCSVHCSWAFFLRSALG